MNQERIFRFSDLPPRNQAVIKFLLLVIGIFTFFLTSTFSYCALTTIHKRVKEGKAYGFTIGESKRNVFDNALKNYGDRIQLIYIGEHPGIEKKFEFSKNKFENISNFDTWTLHLDENLMDSFTLYFKKGRLKEIYRHR
nr:hypothetical protein [Nitrosopumilaceae archaeon]NIV65641.1 hypothetical protein [Nitrosopumilaceae archaeon]NIX61304.1 hypothetical protein [Nitrosopumilaceae archaeon]